jgi:hypothetical protein
MGRQADPKLEDWQKRDVIGPIFGWKRADGTRRFRTAYIEIPRKNGKSLPLLGAGALPADRGRGARRAGLLERDEGRAGGHRLAGAMEMVKASRTSARSCEIHGRTRRPAGPSSATARAAFFRPLGADSTTLDGLNPHAQIVDELHEHKDRRVWAKLQTATGARRQPLTIAITTAGVYDPTALGWQQHKYAQDVLEGAFEDDSYSPSSPRHRRGRRRLLGRDAEEGEPELRRLGVRHRSWKRIALARPRIGGRLQRLSPLPPEPLGAAGDALDPAGEVGGVRSDDAGRWRSQRERRARSAAGRGLRRRAGPLQRSWT